MIARTAIVKYSERINIGKLLWPFLNGDIQVGKEGGGARRRMPPLVKSGNSIIQMVPRLNGRHHTAFTVNRTRFGEKAGSIPARENAPDPVTHHVFTLSSALCLLSEMVSSSMQVSSSSFTADRWQRSLYPQAVRDFLVCITGDTVYRLHKMKC